MNEFFYIFPPHDRDRARLVVDYFYGDGAMDRMFPKLPTIKKFYCGCKLTS